MSKFNRFTLNLKLKKKLIYCSPYIWKKIYLFHQSFVFKGTERNIYNRGSVVPFAFVNLPIKIHSGKRWHSRLVNQWMVGFKFGEFTWNRKIALYKAKQLKKLKKKKKL
jgi:ribosomal protein S19